MYNASVTGYHGTRHFVFTISLSCTIRYACIYGRVTQGSKPLKRSDVTYARARDTVRIRVRVEVRLRGWYVYRPVWS